MADASLCSLRSSKKLKGALAEGDPLNSFAMAIPSVGCGTLCTFSSQVAHSPCEYSACPP